MSTPYPSDLEAISLDPLFLKAKIDSHFSYCQDLSQVLTQALLVLDSPRLVYPSPALWDGSS